MKYFQILQIVLLTGFILTGNKSEAQSSRLSVEAFKPFSIGQNVTSIHYNGILGIGLDYDIFSKNRFVTGMQFDASYFKQSNQSFAVYTNRHSVFSSAAIYLNYKIGRFSPSIFSGIAWQYYSGAETTNNLNIEFHPYSQFGFCSGIGFDFQICPSFSLHSEYNYALFRYQSFVEYYWVNGQSGDNLNVQSINVGMAYRF